MNNDCHIVHGEQERPDLLTHKCRPYSAEDFSCHRTEALRLKQWIQDFVSDTVINVDYLGSSQDDSSGSEMSIQNVPRKCVLLTGPPGVGKTSLVYTIANELKLHVIESHPSEKRDSKLFGMLKLTNQKGKINPIAKLFQVATQQKQQNQINGSRKKRIKLSNQTAAQVNGSNGLPEASKQQKLSLSGDSSIILFDDVDVVFEEDGPFIKSLVEFIKESKRPVVVTATQSIDYIKNALVFCDHIHLGKPRIEDCAKLLNKICHREKFNRITKGSKCQSIAEYLNCDIRQCINRLHFYADKADHIDNFHHANEIIAPQFSKINLKSIDHEDNFRIISCYTNGSLIDVMDKQMNMADKSTLLERWLDGKPSFHNEEHTSNHDLGEQIRNSILELTQETFSKQLKSEKELLQARLKAASLKREFLSMTHKINIKINSRIEPPEKEFYHDIVPMFGEMIKLEARNRISHQTNGGSSRRSRRLISYLDSIGVYLDPDDVNYIANRLIDVNENKEVSYNASQ